MPVKYVIMQYVLFKSAAEFQLKYGRGNIQEFRTFVCFIVDWYQTLTDTLKGLLIDTGEITWFNQSQRFSPGKCGGIYRIHSQDVIIWLRESEVQQSLVLGVWGCCQNVRGYCSHKPQCNATTSPARSVLITIITLHFPFDFVNVNILHLNIYEYNAWSESLSVCCSLCYVTWCPLATGIVASKCSSSRDASLVTRYFHHNKIYLQWICKVNSQLWCCLWHQWLVESPQKLCQWSAPAFVTHEITCHGAYVAL